MRTTLDTLIENNEFPVVFIGAGMSKRFLLNFPDWTTLLKEFWESLGLENFYGEMNSIRDHISEEKPNYTEKELEHYTNIRMGTLLETNYNRAFNSELIKIKDFSVEEAFNSKISPFKKAISERFRTYSLRDGVEEEYKFFKKMLSKTQIILTTNYDSFIEDSYNSTSEYKIAKFIGQKGFFQETYGYAELYKLHGCSDSPGDIIITKNDYEKFEQNSVLISAKIISLMLNSPIIFLGYSLTDINVRKIIKEFTRSLTEQEIQILEERLILIERKKGEKNFIEEVISDQDLGCKLRVIKTDNFKSIFEKIGTINQGIAPTEVRKYQHVIKKLIIDRGKKGVLRSVLLSPEELDKLEANLQNQNITVAIGDEKYIFQIPDIITYSLDYISDKDEISTDIRMRFAAKQQGRIPINKIMDKELIANSSLHPSEKEKLLQKYDKARDFTSHYNTIVSSSIFLRNTKSVSEIINTNEKRAKIYETLSYNIKQLNLDEVKEFLVAELEELAEKGEITLGTHIRRLILLYDILKYKRDNAEPPE